MIFYSSCFYLSFEDFTTHVMYSITHVYLQMHRSIIFVYTNRQTKDKNSKEFESVKNGSFFW